MQDAQPTVADPTTTVPAGSRRDGRTTRVGRRGRVAVIALAAVSALTLLTSSSALAAKPVPLPMTGSCSIVGPITTGWAYNPPRGTKIVSFTFYRDEAQLTDGTWGANGGSDFDGRDGWTSWGEANAPAGWSTAPTWMVAQALNGKGVVLGEVSMGCPG